VDASSFFAMPQTHRRESGIADSLVFDPSRVCARRFRAAFAKKFFALPAVPILTLEVAKPRAFARGEQVCAHHCSFACMRKIIVSSAFLATSRKPLSSSATHMHGVVIGSMRVASSRAHARIPVARTHFLKRSR
jgi:hypothetical protein